MVRRAENDFHFSSGTIKEALINHGSTISAAEVVNGGIAHFLHEHLERASPSIRSRRGGIELHAVDVTTSHVGKLGSRHHKLSLQVSVGIEAVHRNIAVRGSAIINGQFA